jgi:uncharacterized protein YndB with AHSA1/START domain
MKKLRWVALVLVLFVLGLLGFGWLQPREHVASSRLVLRAAPDTVWSLITDHAAMPDWRSGLEKVERAPDQDGHAVWIETSGFGPLPLLVERAEPPRLYRLRIAADDLGFGGTWIYAIEPAGEGCTLTITEDGYVDSLLFRALGPFMGGHHGTMDAYLRDVAKELGEPAAPVHV